MTIEIGQMLNKHAKIQLYLEIQLTRVKLNIFLKGYCASMLVQQLPIPILNQFIQIPNPSTTKERFARN